MPVSPQDFKVLVRILGGWSGWRNERDRQDFLDETLHSSPRADDIVGQLDLGGNPHNSAVRTVSLLNQFGEDIPGREVMCLLIEVLKRNVGNSDRTELEAISSRLNCPATDAETDSVVHPSTDLPIRDRSETNNVNSPKTKHDEQSEEQPKPSSVADDGKPPPPWNVPVVLGLFLALIGSVAAVLALVPEAQRANWFATTGSNQEFATETSDVATRIISTLIVTDNLVFPILSTLPPCPVGEGPNGIRAGYYNSYRLTDEERRWMWQSWGFEGEPTTSWGGLPCGRDYGSGDLNFFAMVCARGHVGPEGYRPGIYDPQALPQSVRQFLWDEFREDGGERGGMAPVGYGGQNCPSN